MLYLRSYKLFISHAFESHEDYAALVELLEYANRLGTAIYSIPEDSRYRKLSKTDRMAELRKQIKPVNCVLILDSIYLANKEVVQYEIEYALAMKKPVIGIRRRKTKDISRVIEDAAKDVVGWNPEVLHSAIMEHSVVADSKSSFL